MFNIYGMLFLASQKGRLVKNTPCRIPTSSKTFNPVEGGILHASYANWKTL